MADKNSAPWKSLRHSLTVPCLVVLIPQDELKLEILLFIIAIHLCAAIH